MEIIEYIILGVIQGFTELLPISSSGHLAIAGFIFKTKNPLQMVVFLHFGSFIAILIMFRSKICTIIDLLLSTIKRSGIFHRKYKHYFENNPEARVPFLILLSLMCTGPVALTLKNKVQLLIDAPPKVGFMLIVNSVILLIVFFLSNRGKLRMSEIGASRACVIGVAQGLAALPGISRLGFTFLAALFCRMEKREAAEYSFLLAVPTIFLASLYELIESFNRGGTSGTGAIDIIGIVFGLIITVIVSCFAIWLFLNKVIRGKRAFLWLAIYCFIAGVVVIIVF